MRIVNPEKHIGKDVDTLDNWREFRPSFDWCVKCGRFFHVDMLDFDSSYREGKENDLYCVGCREGDWRK